MEQSDDWHSWIDKRTCTAAGALISFQIAAGKHASGLQS
jgi:hypothetical protein